MRIRHYVLLALKLIDIDWEKVQGYLVQGASGVQIASHLGITNETLYERCRRDLGKDWSVFSLEHWERGNLGLHAKQYQKAMWGKGNTQMLIHLGEFRLGQKKFVEQKIQMSTESKVKIYLPDNGMDVRE